MNAALRYTINIFLLLLCFGIGTASYGNTINRSEQAKLNASLLITHQLHENSVVALQPQKNISYYSLDAGSVDSSNDLKSNKVSASLVKLFHQTAGYGIDVQSKKVKTDSNECTLFTFPKYLLFHQLRIP